MNSDTGAGRDRPTMRAISQDTLGGPDVLHEITVERPAPGPGEVLVRMRASGLNPTDWKHRGEGMFLGSPPFVLGWDLCGTVEEIGLGVTLFEPGDEVFGMLPYPYGAGAHAEFAVAPARAFAKKPDALDVVEAGAVPLAGLTAWQALVETAQVRQGHRVLIHAAAGGVGHLAVQIAKARGAHVVGTASEGKHAFLRGIGVDEPVDYRTTDPAEVAGEVDIVLDTLGGENTRRSLTPLRRGGTLVTILPGSAQALGTRPAELGVRAKDLLVQHDHHGMTELARLADEGRLRPHIEAVFPLEQAARAHESGEQGRTTGKLVLTTG